MSIKERNEYCLYFKLLQVSKNVFGPITDNFSAFLSLIFDVMCLFDMGKLNYSIEVTTI
jgi:hypothetical protein